MGTIAQGVNIGEAFGSRFGQFGDKGLGFGDLVSILLSNAMVLAGLILLIMLIFGGVSIMIGAGGDNAEAAAKGRQAATAGAIGFGVVFAAYWIIVIIENLTGLKIFNPGF